MKPITFATITIDYLTVMDMSDFLAVACTYVGVPTPPPSKF
jgi:hypothetical protein